MTIIEAIKKVLRQQNEGLTTQEIYQQIENLHLYDFKAKVPKSVVNSELRKHCTGLDFPTAHPIKHFKIAGYEGKKIKFALVENDNLAAVEKRPKEFDYKESLPEEIIDKAQQTHVAQIKQELLNKVMEAHPRFFEQLVVELLLKMGYGYDQKSGIVTGGSHDNGIDGIISEDKLDLDRIYIQAKRYAADNKIGRKEIQAFIGAMGHIQKGVFITTSRFTKEAAEFGAQQQQKNIKLIDGSMLADFMVKYDVGVEKVKSFSIYRINKGYFTE